MQQYYLKKRVEVVFEAPLLGRITDRLDHANVSGYSIVPIVGGRGHSGSWTSDGQISDTTKMVMLFCIADPSKVDDIVDVIFAAISHQIGFVTISDVLVIRAERF